MKKRAVLIFILSLILISYALLNLHIVKADAESDAALQQATGLQLNKIQQTQTSLQNANGSYLVQEWSKIIANTSVIGPIHKFLLNHDILIKIVFATNYEISLTFVFIILFWAITCALLIKITSTFPIIKDKYLKMFIGILFTIVLAQTGLYRFIVTGMLSIALNRENYWVRMILIAVILLIYFLYYGLGKVIVSIIKDKQNKDKKDDLIHAQNIIKTTADSIVKNKNSE